jgi:hypothetical protein
MTSQMNERNAMKCEEFEMLGLGCELDPSLAEEVHLQASEHVRHCVNCAGLRDSWEEAKTELATLRQYTASQQAPPRVKIRVLQEFQTKHHSAAARKTVKFAAWSLAAAALLACAMGLENWRTSRRASGPGSKTVERSSGNTNRVGNNVAVTVAPGGPELIADTGGDFTPLPGGIWQEAEEGSIIRVGMQRATLGAFGFPVNEERAGDWIQVDLLVAADGSPQAVRFAE